MATRGAFGLFPSQVDVHHAVPAIHVAVDLNQLMKAVVALNPTCYHLADVAEHVHGGHFSDRAEYPVVPAGVGGEIHRLKCALAALGHFPLALHRFIEPGTDQRNDIVVSTLAAEASRDIPEDCLLHPLQWICFGHLLAFGVGAYAGDDAPADQANQVVIAQARLCYPHLHLDAGSLRVGLHLLHLALVVAMDHRVFHAGVGVHDVQGWHRETFGGQLANCSERDVQRNA